MSSCTLTMPQDLEDLEERVVQATVAALEGAAEDALTRAKTDPALSVVTGGARASLSVSPVRYEGTRLRVGIIATGEAAQRAEVLDGGRRPGARGPTARQLAFPPGARGAKWSDMSALRGGWIWKRCRDEVNAKAEDLAVAYFAAHPTKRKGVKRPAKAYFVLKAIYVLAESKASAVHNLGIRARGFVSKQGPYLRERLRLHLRAQFARFRITTRRGT